LVTERSKILFC